MRERRLELDIIRILACFLVIFNHQSGYKLYQVSGTGLKTWLYMLPTMITRINVPLFFMISGTLLLTNKQETYREILKKRFLRIVYALFLFTTILQVVELVQGAGEFSAYKFLIYLIGEPAAIGGGPYWYLYCYLGFILFLPFLRRITEGITKEDFILIMILHFITLTMIPIINLVLVSFNFEKLFIGSDFVDSVVISTAKFFFFPIVGFYIDRRIDLDKLKKKQLVLLTFLTILGIVISCVCTMYEGTHGKMIFTQNYVQLFDYVTAIWVFIIIKLWVIKRFDSKCSGQTAKVINSIGTLTLGIYLFDPVFKKIICKEFYLALEPHIDTIFVSILWCIMSMIVGGISTLFFKKVPLLKRIFM